jgi:hypothetical protein
MNLESEVKVKLIEFLGETRYFSSPIKREDVRLQFIPVHILIWIGFLTETGGSLRPTSPFFVKTWSSAVKRRIDFW